MKLKAWNGTALIDIQPPDIKDYCRKGIYICCKKGGGHSHDDVPTTCCLHLWIYAGPLPIPHHNVMIHMMKRDVPHVNGKGKAPA